MSYTKEYLISSHFSPLYHIRGCKEYDVDELKRETDGKESNRDWPCMDIPSLKKRRRPFTFYKRSTLSIFRQEESVLKAIRFNPFSFELSHDINITLNK